MSESLSHVEVVRKDRAADMADAAGRIGGVSLKVIGSEGQAYPLHGGGELTVPEGSMAVQVTDTGGEGTSNFYREANSVTAARQAVEAAQAAPSEQKVA